MGRIFSNLVTIQIHLQFGELANKKVLFTMYDGVSNNQTIEARNYGETLGNTKQFRATIYVLGLYQKIYSLIFFYFSSVLSFFTFPLDYI